MRSSRLSRAFLLPVLAACFATTSLAAIPADEGFNTDWNAVWSIERDGVTYMLLDGAGVQVGDTPALRLAASTLGTVTGASGNVLIANVNPHGGVRQLSISLAADNNVWIKSLVIATPLDASKASVFTIAAYDNGGLVAEVSGIDFARAGGLATSYGSGASALTVGSITTNATVSAGVFTLTGRGWKNIDHLVIKTTQDLPLKLEIDTIDFEAPPMPVILNLGGDSVTFTENGSAVQLDLSGNATVSSSAVNFGGGNVTVTIASGGSSEYLGFSSASTVKLLGSTVSIGSTPIGVIAGGNKGEGGTPLSVNLYGNATIAEVNTLLQAITYLNTSDTPAASRTVSFTVDDGANGTSAAASVTVTITAVNDAPTLDAISDPAAILEDAGQQTIALPGISAGPGETQTLTVTASSSNPALIPNPTVTYTSPNATGSLSYTPVANANGSAVITVTVKDNGGAANGGVNTFSRTFTVNVTPVNDVPTNVSLSSSTLNHSAGLNAVVGTLSATDADVSDTFTFSLVAGDGDTDNALFQISGTSLQARNAANVAAGNRSVRVQVDDGHGGTFAKSFTIAVTDNLAPGAPSKPELAAASDTGVSSSDKITSDTTPTFTGTAEADSTVTLYDTDGTTVLGTGTATGGTWNITAPELGAGSHTATAKAADAAGNVSNASSGLTFTIDTAAAVVSSVGVPANGTYLTGQNLAFTVNWSEQVVTNTTGDTPSIAVTVGGTTRQATYQSGSGTNALVFRYTTQSGDLDSDGVAVGAAVTLNGGTITDRAGNPATLTLNSVGSTAAVLVDAVAPTVTGQTVPSNGTYKLGQHLDFTVTYSENVTVVGTPYIAVTLATGGTVQAAYNGGTSTTTLTFRYTVVAGNLDAAGIAVDSSITLNGGTIKDAAGNDAPITALGFGDTTGVLVDGVAPTVSTSNRQTPASVTTKATSVTYRVTFSEPVTGVDLADFALTKTGTASGTIASVSPVTGSETTVYDVVVTSVSGNGTLRLDLNAAATGIADLATNAIIGGYTGGQTYTIDNTIPTLGAIARQTPATVNTSASTVTWRVTFSEGVTGVEAGDFVLTAPADSGSTATGVIASVTGVAGSETTSYDVVVNVSGQGPARLDLKASGTGIADVTGNALADGGFTTGDFYLVGITNVFDTLGMLPGTTRVVQGSTNRKVAQRFTTGATAPLSLTTVAARLGAIVGTPLPVVSVYTDNADPVGGTLVATLTNPASLSASALNLWTSTQLLTASTTYWLVFEDASAAGSYEIAFSGVTTGGVGAWLTTYAYAHGVDFATNPQAGSLRIAIGATSTPVITSSLTGSGAYGTAFAGYTITATNTPTSFAATGLPTGLSLNATTGVISGTPTQAGTFNVTLTGTNGSGTGPGATLVLTIAKAPLTVRANNASRYVGYSNPVFTLSYSGFRNGDTAASLAIAPAIAPTATTTATNASPVGTYPITPAGGVSNNYDFSYVNGTLTVSDEPPPSKQSQTITFTPLGNAVVGGAVTLSASASSGLPVSFSLVSGPATLSGGTVTCTGIGVVTVRATQTGDASYDAATPVERSFSVGLPTPTVTTPTQVPVPEPGGTATLTVPTLVASATYQWRRNGADLANATTPTLNLPDVQPPAAGLYTYTVQTAGGAAATSEPVIVGVSTEEKVTGTAAVVNTDVQHPNGNTYDQLLLEGQGATLTADPGKVTRMSFNDLSDDIVQIEFSGAGSLSLVMDDASTPAPAANYNQPGVNYVRGHVGIVITGADETTNLTVFSVGRVTAFDPTGAYDITQPVSETNDPTRNGNPIFDGHPTSDYDGMANVAFIAIQSTNGKFGGLRTGNVEYFAANGFTGVYAPGVEFTGPLYVGDIQAHDNARPVLVVGSASDVRVTGGSLAQPNGQPITVAGFTQLTMAPGQTSQGDALAPQPNQGVLEQDGVDVTKRIVGP